MVDEIEGIFQLDAENELSFLGGAAWATPKMP